MIPGGIFGQIYLGCLVLGTGYLFFNVCLGNFDHDGGDAGHDGGDGHADGHAHGDGDADGHGDADADGHGDESMSKTGALPVVHRGGKIVRFVLGVLSPIGISIWLTFFGLSGFISMFYVPWLGAITLIPAFLIGMAASNTFKSMIRLMVRRMAVSTNAKVHELVGHQAEVNIPITEGAVGEVTYVVGSKRYQSAAKPAKPGQEFPRGAKVMIAHSEPNLVLVEPWLSIALNDDKELESKFEKLEKVEKIEDKLEDKLDEKVETSH